MTFQEALILGGATLAFVAVMGWWVLRPFERYRRELRRARRQAAE